MFAIKNKQNIEVFINVKSLKFKDFKDFSKAFFNNDFISIINLGVMEKLNLDDFPIDEISKMVDEIVRVNEEDFFCYSKMEAKHVETSLSMLNKLS